MQCAVGPGQAPVGSGINITIFAGVFDDIQKGRWLKEWVRAGIIKRHSTDNIPHSPQMQLLNIIYKQVLVLIEDFLEQLLVFNRQKTIRDSACQTLFSVFRYGLHKLLHLGGRRQWQKSLLSIAMTFEELNQVDKKIFKQTGVLAASDPAEQIKETSWVE